MPDSHPHHFEATLADAWPTDSWQDVTVLLAVSGGADSVALLRAADAIKEEGSGRLYVAHFNHRLRGEESDADQAFVADLCERLGVACELGGSDVAGLAESKGDGVEAAARDARYEFLRETAQRVGARHVVTAHTADDQAETILHRVVRGTGLSGLSGMAKSRELCDGIALTRPMLKLHRTDVLDYLNDLEQPFREDTSNRDLRYTRNRIRRELLPQLEAGYNPQAVDALLRLGRLAGEAQQVVDARVDELWEAAIVKRTPTDALIDTAALLSASDYLVRELLMTLWRRQHWPQQQMSLAHWEQLASMVLGRGIRGGDSAPAASTLPGGVQAKKEGEQLMLTRPR